MTCNLITILGPTATGKTSFAAKLASKIQGEIISADSRQVYRDMNLGTGKDYEDYQSDSGKIPYHLIDICPAGYKYNVYEFQRDFFKIFTKVVSKKKVPIMVGGTGMYLESVLNNYNLIPAPMDEELRTFLSDKSQKELVEILSSYNTSLHNSSDTKIKSRTIRAIEIAKYYSLNKNNIPDTPKINSLIFGIDLNREARRKKITDRLQTRMEDGLIQEVQELMEKIPAEDLLFYGLEYKYITLHLMGKLTYQEMFDQLNIAIHQFAKRQMTWFRRMERNGFKIYWINGLDSDENKMNFALNLIHEKCSGTNS